MERKPQKIITNDLNTDSHLETLPSPSDLPYLQDSSLIMLQNQINQVKSLVIHQSSILQKFQDTLDQS